MSSENKSPLFAVSLAALILVTIAIAGLAAMRATDSSQTPADAAQPSHRAATMSIPF